ncbi:MAG: hypothetical protein IT175_01105 [Acidobacteria bacterium]|nr:hypothetical protein [Acidobacteriota bacterium]
MAERVHPPGSVTSTTYRSSQGAVLTVCVILAPTLVLIGWALQLTSGLRHTLLLLVMGLLSLFLVWVLLRLGETVVIDDESITRRAPLLGQSLLRWADVADIEVVEGPAVGRAFRLTSGVAPPLRVSDFIARYDDALADALARIPARAYVQSYLVSRGAVRDRIDTAMSGRAAVDETFLPSVRAALEAIGLVTEAATLEHRIVARPRRDVIDSATEPTL